jgi:putative MATE family efflux protein
MKKIDKTHLLLHEKNLYRAFIILAIPVITSNILKSFHDLVDTYFIGQLQNSAAAQAGIAVSWPLINIFLSLSSGLAIAGVALISQNLGAENYKMAKKYSGLLLTLAVGIGIFINLFLYFLSPHILRIIGATEGVFDAALTYIRVRSFEMVFLFIFTAFQAIRQASGDTITPVILSSISIMINIILTAIFTQVLNMGVLGAALGTLIGQMAIAPACLILLFTKKDKASITVKDLGIVKEYMVHLFNVAMPSAASQALSSLGFLIMQAMILSYGDTVSAAFSNGNKVANMLLIPNLALGAVLAAFIGQNIGAGNKERAKKSYAVSRNYSLIISIAGVLALFPFRKYLLGLLTNNPETLAISLEYIIFVLLSQPFLGLFQNYMGLYNGSGNTKFSFLFSIVRLWGIRIPLILFFKTFTDLGRVGVWYALVISNTVILILGHYLAKKIDYRPRV